MPNDTNTLLDLLKSLNIKITDNWKTNRCQYYTFTIRGITYCVSTDNISYCLSSEVSSFMLYAGYKINDLKSVLIDLIGDDNYVC